ncbi:hypothetical protein, partial [Mycobacterium avium]|uniref:hypothetical protein n=1 Tax=Mycobacterium avium TaxID=1764 RepID=UPI0011538967
MERSIRRFCRKAGVRMANHKGFLAERAPIRGEELRGRQAIISDSRPPPAHDGTMQSGGNQSVGRGARMNARRCRAALLVLCGLAAVPAILVAVPGADRADATVCVGAGRRPRTRS